jgi:hypothetical protein
MRLRPVLSGFGWTVAAVLATVSAVQLVHAADLVSGDRSTSEVRLQAGGIGTFSRSLANLMPGDSVTQTILVANDGSAELRYSLSISSEDPDGKQLGDVLALTIRTADSSPARSCAMFDGSTLYAGSLGADGGFGKPEPGAHRYDRRLGPGAVDMLCLRIDLPLDAGNRFQGARTTAAFTFSAEQTQDNP